MQSPHATTRSLRTRERCVRWIASAFGIPRIPNRRKRFEGISEFTILNQDSVDGLAKNNSDLVAAPSLPGSFVNGGDVRVGTVDCRCSFQSR